jgi:beta-lactamase class C
VNVIRSAASVALLGALIGLQSTGHAVAAQAGDVRTIVTQAVVPLMKQYGIPGMAVGITIDGRHYIFDYGVASKETGKPVDRSTLFEIGSITKTFTASLASYAQVVGKLSLYEDVSADFPPLRGTSFDHISLVNLGTHTAGGLPLQFPDAVQNDSDALRYYQQWRPSHPAGTYRLYSNPSIMLLGLVAAKRLGSNFISSMQQLIFNPLGLRDTFLIVPKNQLSRYAQGYTSAGKPRRMLPGPLAPEAYGIRTTASDVLRFVDANMRVGPLDGRLRRAIEATHTGYYRLGAMTQDLVWEQYHYPVSLPNLLQGNSDHVILEENRVTPVDPPSAPGSDVIINKTGSTNGFGAYVAFIPQQKIGIVLLANKSYPISARVTTAYRILEHI